MKRILMFFGFILLLPALTNAQAKGYGNSPSGRGERGGRGYSGVSGEAGSALSIVAESGDRFYLILNGVKQNSYPQMRIRVEQLPNVVNDVQIIFDDNRTPAINKRIAFADPLDGRAVNLTLRLTRDRQGYPRLLFQRLTPLEVSYRGETGEYVMCYGRDNQPRQVVTTPPLPTAMDGGSFAEAKQAIKSSSWDETRLSTAQSIVNVNYLNTDQVIEICKLFSWDDTRLTFAKYAFKRTVDNNNYFRVNTVFDWDDNKKALNDYVSANR